MKRRLIRCARPARPRSAKEGGREATRSCSEERSKNASGANDPFGCADQLLSVTLQARPSTELVWLSPKRVRGLRALESRWMSVSQRCR